MNPEIQQALEAMEEVLKYRRGDGKYNLSKITVPEERYLEALFLWHEVENQLIIAIEKLKKNHANKN